MAFAAKTKGQDENVVFELPFLQVADKVVHGDLWHEDEVAQPHCGVERHDDGLNALTGLSLNNPPNCHHTGQV